jgi:hypothetical protein
MRATVLAVIAVSFLAPASSRAAGFRPWAGVSGSWATYSMKDVNNDIADINATIAGTGLQMDEIHNGFAMGAMLGGDFDNQITVGIGYDHLFASSEVGDATGSLKYDYPANAIRALGEYRFPSTSQFQPHAGMALGLVAAAGSVKLSQAGVGAVSGDVSGTGPLAEFYGGGDYRVAPTLFVNGSLGYRYAKIGEIKIQDQTVLNPDGSKYALDYSGLLIRLGLKLAFGQ